LAPGAFNVTQLWAAPERKNVLAALQPLSLSQRMTKRIAPAFSKATSQVAG